MGTAPLSTVSAHGVAGFRRDIQGLRAIAVLSVVAYHANRNLLSGGFVGVDIFFVISGYLIAGILLGEMERNAFSLANFYERRVRRLFPALFVMLAACLGAGAVLLAPSQFNDLGRTTFSTIFFVSNFDFFFHSGYFDAAAQDQPLLHTWSLAVEEQFYVLFPLLLFALYRFARRLLRVALIVLALASLVACEAVTAHHQAAAFFLAPFRAFELLLGAMIARLPFPSAAPPLARHGLSFLGLAMIAWSLFELNEAVRFPGVSALPACVGAALVLISGAGAESFGGRLISTPPFVFFGRLSYSLYLWHWPLFVFARFALLRAPTGVETAVLAMIAIVLAAASWRWIERPFLRPRGRPWRALRSGAAAMAVGAAAAASIAVFDGLPQRFDAPSRALFAQAGDFSPERGRCHNNLAALWSYQAHCALGASNTEAAWAVWSDSHGVEFAYALAEAVKDRGEAVLEISASACPPASGFGNPAQPLCAAQNEIEMEGLLHDNHVRTVVFLADFLEYRDIDHRRLNAGFARAVERVAAAGKQVVLVYPIPVFAMDPPTALGELAARHSDPAGYALSRAAYDDESRDTVSALDELAARTHAVVLRPADILCDRARCRAYNPAVGALYFNRNHLSMRGARMLAARTLEQIAAPL